MRPMRWALPGHCLPANRERGEDHEQRSWDQGSHAEGRGTGRGLQLSFWSSVSGAKVYAVLPGPQIEQLSPGQRGALLLIFYLLVDKGRNPIVLDRPEENLNNETVVSLFVRSSMKRRSPDRLSWSRTIRTWRSCAMPSRVHTRNIRQEEWRTYLLSVGLYRRRANEQSCRRCAGGLENRI